MSQRLIATLLFGSLFSCNGNKDKHSAQAFPKPIGDADKPALSYAQTKSGAELTRQALREEYSQATAATQWSVLARAGDSLVKIIGENFYAQWKGTSWDFNGTTNAPNKGSITCGYFVTGLLRDAGYPLNRVKLSTCPSLTMMKELTSPAAIKNQSTLSYAAFVHQLKENGKALYAVGLDFHTGFIVNDGKEAWFLHSNYIGKIGVVKEKIEESAALKGSKTRYLTCLSNHEKFLRTWLFR